MFSNCTGIVKDALGKVNEMLTNRKIPFGKNTEQLRNLNLLYIHENWLTSS